MDKPIADRMIRRAAGSIALACALALPLLAQADGAGKPRPTNPDWQEECGGCHIAYPPRMLPAESWKRLMQGLDDHFGTDATIDAGKTSAIEAFLVANARKPKPDAPVDAATAPLRISEMKWFRGEHRKISAAKWKSPEINSPANCGACHRGADQGRFDEDEIKIPKGGSS